MLIEAGLTLSAELDLDAVLQRIVELACEITGARYGALGVLGVPLPYVETGIALSAIALGAMVAFAAKPPLWIAALLVAAFAIFHGHAHGAELPSGADAVAYSIGFVVATGMLHLAGIAFGGLSRWPAGRIAVRALGGIAALVGFAYLTHLV